MKSRSLISLVFAGILVVATIVSATAADDFRGKPLPENWKETMDLEYSLNKDNYPAAQTCQLFQRTTNHNFVCAENIAAKRITIHQKASFSEIFDAFLTNLGAEAVFSDNYVFIGKPGDPGLGEYPRPANLPPIMFEEMALDFRKEKLPDLTRFITKVTGIPVQLAPSLQSRFIGIHVTNIPFIEAMEVIARTLQAPLKVANGTVYLG